MSVHSRHCCRHTCKYGDETCPVVTGAEDQEYECGDCKDFDIASSIDEIRAAFADYVASEGCSCCRNASAHDKAADRLAKLLGVPKYSDGSGWDFMRYRTSKE